MSHDIMIDLETLATTADAAILSIGAVHFDLDAGTVFDQTFYSACSIDSQPGRAISGSTLAWWMDQCKDAKDVFADPHMRELEFVLAELDSFMGATPGIHPTVWSNGADFDLPMLTHAYKQFGWTPPWKPYAGRCYRTYKNLPSAHAIKLERTGQHHNALDDAIYQARHLCAIHQALFMTHEEGILA